MAVDRGYEFLSGMRDLEGLFLLLSDEKEAKRLAREAVKESIKIFRDEAIKNALVIDRSGTPLSIAKNIAIRQGRVKRKGAVKSRVGVAKGYQFWEMHKNMIRKDAATGKKVKVKNPYYYKGRNRTPYWWLVELGTKHSKARPFIRPALTAKRSAVEVKFSEVFMRDLLKTLRARGKI